MRMLRFGGLWPAFAIPEAGAAGLAAAPSVHAGAIFIIARAAVVRVAASFAGLYLAACLICKLQKGITLLSWYVYYKCFLHKKG